MPEAKLDVLRIVLTKYEYDVEIRHYFVNKS